MKKIFLALCLPLFLTSTAHGLFEVRAGYGLQTPSDPDGVNSLTTMHGFNLDALVKIPLVPVGLGLRYENMGFDLEAGAQSLSSSMQRTSLLVNYRIIDFFFYLGAIGSIGFVNDATIGIPGLGERDFNSSLTYSVGVEGGVSLGLMKVGAELGYLGANFGDNSGAGLPDIDLSGIYAKALVGFGF